jgi:glycolate oxidase FAD binding subunit
MTSTTAFPDIAYSPTTVDEVQELVQALPKLIPHGGQSKPPLLKGAGENVARIDMRKITGISEYEPGEYTFTAFAGPPLAEIAAALAEHGQYMPFDPPLAGQGATLGGTIAAGISGSGRYRYGGLRDFILGVQIVDGQGRLIRGGGKVVKNAAGFDLPKLMVGSLGRLAILISASFKVFPAPLTTASLSASFGNLTQALAAMARLMGGPYDLEALDLRPQTNGSVTLLARIGGSADVLAARLERLRTVSGAGDPILEDKQLWADAGDFSWLESGDLLVKVPTTAQVLPALDHALQDAGIQRRYAVGGNLAWIAWRGPVEESHQMLTKLGLSGLVLRGESQRAFIGKPPESAFLSRVRAALDPNDRFVDFE